MRPSPTESATLFTVGTSKKGNDGRTYIVRVTKAGIKRWVAAASSNNTQKAGHKLHNSSDQERCIKQFARYERKTGPDSWQILQGAREERDGHTFIDGYELPPGFRRKSVSRDFIVEHFCKAPINKTKMASVGALEMNDWYERSRPKWLTIGDVVRMKEGEALKLLVMDRNLMDTVDAHNVRGKAHSPTNMFRKNFAIFTKTHGIRGEMQWEDAKTPFEFDIEFKKGRWYPLEDDHLPSHDPQSMFSLFGSKKPWSAFPKSTHIGWRGPMVKWSHLSTMPPVYID